MLPAYFARSGLRPVIIVRASGEAIWTSTNNASATNQLAPVTTLTFNVQGAGPAALVGPSRRPSAARNRPVPARPEASEKPVDDKAEAAVVDAPPLAAETADLSAPSVPQLPGGAADDHPRAAADDRPHGVAGDVSSAVKAAAVDIALSIDSLPSLKLKESIPVTVVQLGDNLFTATIAALHLTGTGDTLSEALITVKEQVEVLFLRLSNGVRLDDDENTHLQYLQSYILSTEEPPSVPKRRFWS